MRGQHIVRATAWDNTGQNTRTHTQSQDRIKISDSAENRTRAAGLEGADSTDHAREKDVSKLLISIFEERVYHENENIREKSLNWRKFALEILL